MQAAALSWNDVETIALSEARKFRVYGHDTEDIEQEARLAAHRAMSRLDGRAVGSRRYVRESVRGALTNVLRRAEAQSRRPTDGRNRVLFLAPLEENTGALEARTELALDIRTLLKKVPDKKLAAVVDAIRDAMETKSAASTDDDRLRAVRGMLDRLIVEAEEETMIEEPTLLMFEKARPCHADGDAPLGYDPTGKEQCAECMDKFTCLPKTIRAGLTEATMESDLEVAAVWAGKRHAREMTLRMERRVRLQLAGAPIPPELSHTWPALIPAPLKPSTERRKKLYGKSWKMPDPKPTTPDKMLLALERVRLGQDFTLGFGMRIERILSTGREVAIAVTEQGFDAAGRLYSSLSAATMSLENRSCSGNDFFSLKHRGVTIRDSAGTVLVRSFR